MIEFIMCQHMKYRLQPELRSIVIGWVSQVPPQPLWFAPGLANVRKLQELPHHLLHAGLWEELRQEVVGRSEMTHFSQCRNVNIQFSSDFTCVHRVMTDFSSVSQATLTGCTVRAECVACPV